jgi:hypothetical protein
MHALVYSIAPTISGKKKLSLNQACSVFYAVRVTSAKFGVHASNVMFNARSEG